MVTISTGFGPRTPTVAVALGVGLLVFGLGAMAWVAMTGTLPGLEPGAKAVLGIWTFAPAVMFALLGLSLTLCGMHMRLSYAILAEMQSITTEVDAPRAPLMAPRAVAPVAMPYEAEPEQPRVTAHIPQRQPIRASHDKPIKGKPFKPHPIFMARPPR